MKNFGFKNITSLTISNAKTDKVIWHIQDINDINDEFILQSLKQSGKRLKELLGITEEDIDRVIRELRREW